MISHVVAETVSICTRFFREKCSNTLDDVIMAKAKALQKRIKITQISETKNLARLCSLLEAKYECRRVEDRGDYVAFHYRISLQRDQEVDVVVFTSDIVLIRASPKVLSELFDKGCSAIETLANQAISPVSVVRPLTTLRAKTILDYASKLNPSDEIQRMVIVILCDTVNEIILREQMKALEIKGPPLDEGIPEKIKRIEEKGQAVYKSKEVKNIRDLRNGIVHQGHIPDESQAKECLEITSDFLAQA